MLEPLVPVVLGDELADGVTFFSTNCEADGLVVPVVPAVLLALAFSTHPVRVTVSPDLLCRSMDGLEGA
jgi:hypothetical protein